MQSEARGEGDLGTDIEPVGISITESDHYIHYSLSESTLPALYNHYKLE